MEKESPVGGEELGKYRSETTSHDYRPAHVNTRPVLFGVRVSQLKSPANPNES